MIKIHDQDFESFIIFSIQYKEKINGELFKLYCDNPNDTVFLEFDIDSIEGKHWKSKVRFDILKRNEQLNSLLNYYTKFEEYEKCMIINELKIKIKENYLESV